jgi:hypothetical protein
MELNFLGYTIKYRDNWSKKFSFFKDRIGQPGIALYPQKDKVKNIINKLRLVFKKNLNLSAYELIAKLNPIIRAWSSYFNMGESYAYRGYVRYALYKLIWNWAYKKHPRWGKRKIAKFYFTGEDKRKTNKAINTLWNFYGKTSGDRWHSNKGSAITWLVDPTNVTTTVPARIYSITNDLLEIHAYHEDIKLLEERLTKANLASLGKTEGLKGKLISKQKGICPICEKSLFHNSEHNILEAGFLDIDHIIPISEGGSKTKMDNLRLLHRWCHKERHKIPN